MNNHKPLGKRKTIQLLVILTILAWATQTLVHQWGFGDEIAPLAATPEMVSGDKFVASPDDAVVTGTLELRTEATVVGAEVKLKQICRWPDADAATFAPIADLKIARLTDGTPFRSVSVDDVRQTLHDAGVNLATINFIGAAACTVTRSDAQGDEHQALEQWIDANQTKPSGSTPIAPSATQPDQTVSAPSAAVPAASQDKPFHSLRDLLTIDLCQRLGVSPDAIQLSFSPEDEKVLSLADTCFKFDIQPDRVRNLGRVSWDVGIFSDTASKKVTIQALARAWQEEIVVARPMSLRQVLRETDFTRRRILSDSLPEQTLLTLDQCADQQAACDLKPGTVMTARLVDPVPLVHTGDLVTVTLTQGTVQIKTVARAMEPGTAGQTIKVRNETTRDIFDVVVTGEQEARLGDSSTGAGIASGGN